MIKPLSESEFLFRRRDLLLSYDLYRISTDEITKDVEAITEALAQPSEKLAKLVLGQLRLSVRQRATSSLDYLATMYSAGHELGEMRALFPQVLLYWQEFAEISLKFAQTPEGQRAGVSHISLLSSNFVYANQLISFALLFGWRQLLDQVTALIDFNNPVRDGMLERILAIYVDRRESPPNECTRHLPYYKTLKIFKAAAGERSELMAEYLSEWYWASRREVYYDSHLRGTIFTGYWSWEAGAITLALDIDDRMYANAQFYPADLVRFGRECRDIYSLADGIGPKSNELRARAGDPCPLTGRWQALGVDTTIRMCRQGETMPDLGSPYGLTVWRMDFV